VDEQEKFKMYYEYSEPVKTIPSHRMLAIRRGEAENILYFLIEVQPNMPSRFFNGTCCANRATGRASSRWPLTMRGSDC